MNKTAGEILEKYIMHLTLEGKPEDEEWGAYTLEDYSHDTRCELREGKFETNIECDWSSHYESKSVGIYIEDFNGFTGYIGWTYWFGGGKHGNPDDIDWIPEAYFLDLIKEEVITVTKRTFEKCSPPT